jgi:hypothetical protein
MRPIDAGSWAKFLKSTEEEAETVIKMRMHNVWYFGIGTGVAMIILFVRLFLLVWIT